MTNKVMKDKRYVFVELLLCILCLFGGGCGKPLTGGIQEKETAMEMETTRSAETAMEMETTRSTETVTESKVLLTDLVSEEEMTLADAWPSCDDRALAEVMRKAENRETVTIACIGGSITQGTISTGNKDREIEERLCYADLFFRWWSRNFPDTEFQFINAGIGATDSYLGVHRVDRDVLAYEPDLVLVEYSVNDGDNAFYKKTYDNLVRKILQSEVSPAVMLLFMGQSNGQSAQASHVLVGFQYKLPMISYVNVMKDMLEQDMYEEKDLSGDVTHPSALGHAIVGEILGKYLNQVNKDKDFMEQPEEFAAKPVTNEMYRQAKFLTRKELSPDTLGSFTESNISEAFPDSWNCQEGEGGLTFTLSFANLGVAYYGTTDGLGGQYEILVDGEVSATLNADFQGRWGNYVDTVEVYRSGEVSIHTVEIRKKADSAGSSFSLAGLLTS